ncbi:MAG: hypothetical protein QXT36_03280 [Candidatus Micrarchaeaceae archaeon]
MEKLFKCDICGLHYRDEKLAKMCHDWCSAHNSCNLSIARHSVEAQKSAAQYSLGKDDK